MTSILAKTAGVLAVIAGALIVLSGVATNGILFSFLTTINRNILSGLGGTFVILQLIIDVLTFLMGLGGITVIFGGAMILYNHRFLGRLLIALGGGMGFLGLFFALIYSLFTAGFNSLVIHIEHWIGVVLAAIARRIAK
jgi:hypothetical protein